MILRLKHRIRSEAKKLASKWRFAAAVDRANKKAWADYRQIIKLRPEAALSSAQMRQIKDYARDILGSRDHAPGLFAYAAWRGEFLEGLIPSSYFHAVLIPSWTPFPSYDRKTFAKRILVDPPMTDLVYFIRGFWLDASYRPIPRDAVIDHLFSDCDRVFVKTDVSLQGLGVHKATRDDFDITSIERLGDLVIQAPIYQHSWFDDFTPGSVATVRITTVKMPGAPAQARACYLRLARAGADIVRSAESIRVAVNAQTGALSADGVTYDWRTIAAHPDSHQPFGGRSIPHFDRLLEFCRQQHDSTPISGLIGWDVTIDRNDDPVLIEWNQGRANISFMETVDGPGFRGLAWENVWKASQD
ncbi:MAG: hypothetical protein JJ902_07595 [Roseibium sp.]|nr:hypothetical protein [Roseibium sp.]